MKPDVYQLEWEKKATVRSMPRFLFEDNDCGYFYPLSRQPLSIHPLVEDLGNDALRYLLAQSLYKYTNDITTIEIRVVNRAILTAVNDCLPVEFNHEHKLKLYTIMVDESYHAYVAYDAMLQIQQYTRIKPLPLPKSIEVEFAIHEVKSTLAPLYHNTFEFIAVCLAENTLTKEMISMLDEEETHPFFQILIKGHLSDESRHSGVFFQLLKYLWSRLADDFKFNVGCALPEFLSLYLGLSVQVAFDKTVLLQLGLSELEANEAISDTYSSFQVTHHHPMLKNILVILAKAGVLEGVILQKFKERDWL